MKSFSFQFGLSMFLVFELWGIVCSCFALLLLFVGVVIKVLFLV